MLRSSLGFHTLTLFIKITYKEMEQLLEHFKQHSKETGLIKIFPLSPPKRVKRTVYDGGRSKVVNEVKSVYKIDYYKEDRGIEWLIRFNNNTTDYESYIIEVTINPKILGGINDYINAASFDDMETAVECFNLEMKRISPILRNFNCYKLKRIDYCVNFDLSELAGNCPPELIMELIRKGNIPTHYHEWMKYCETSHRMKSDPASFYLTNNSLHINCYSKYMQMQQRSNDRVEKGLDPIPQIILDSARNIIRFEVQCKYLKTYSLSMHAIDAGNLCCNKYSSLLDHYECIKIIEKYFDKIIKQGDWYTLQEAIKKIKSMNFNKQREQRLINVLQHVNQCRSLTTAKQSFQDDDLKDFKKTLKELSSLKINPVTIPKEWGVKHIPDLLHTYLIMAAEERDNVKTPCCNGINSSVVSSIIKCTDLSHKKYTKKRLKEYSFPPVSLPKP